MAVDLNLGFIMKGLETTRDTMAAAIAIIIRCHFHFRVICSKLRVLKNLSIRLK
jgi:hypothetical protein